ncbi:MAG: helix-turn-helix domain-containing protein [Chloroflexi bacterium]|nr:helix-turn-helix domain-containing protein [Chloroflexota bacterium]
MFLTTRQAAKRLGICEQRVRQLIYEGRLKAVKIGGHNLIAEEDCHYERKRDYPVKPKGDAR